VRVSQADSQRLLYGAAGLAAIAGVLWLIEGAWWQAGLSIGNALLVVVIASMKTRRD
jgi:hypothetical protein